MTELKRLEPVDLRTVWEHEATDFTPWLAQEENIGILGDTLGIELEARSTEEPVGPFRADVVCTDQDGDYVLIENQIVPTDHRHLGQVLTYAAGLEAVTIIWIAERVKAAHRKSIDWLNLVTIDSVRFFALEIKLWKIGKSGPAPYFNVISKPNEWDHPGGGSSQPDDLLRPHQLAHLSFWERFIEHLNVKRKPGTSNWMSFGVGSGSISRRAKRLKGGLRVELYVRGRTHKSVFSGLRAEKTQIEKELGFELEWVQNPDASSIRVTNDVDPSNEDDWVNQMEWLVEKLGAFDRVFRGRLKNIKLADDITEDDLDD